MITTKKIDSKKMHHAINLQLSIIEVTNKLLGSLTKHFLRSLDLFHVRVLRHSSSNLCSD